MPLRLPPVSPALLNDVKEFERNKPYPQSKTYMYGRYYPDLKEELILNCVAF